MWVGKHLALAAALAIICAPMTAQTQQASEYAPVPIRLFEVEKQGRPLYVLGREFDYCLDETGEIIRVPAGFVTDFASIPPPASAILKPDGPYAKAAIIHDYIYAVGQPGKRKFADNVLRAAMIDYGVPKADRDIVFGAVRFGGASGYGLPGDWLFYDLDLLKPTHAPPKPKSAVFEKVSVGCKEFHNLEQGWRAGTVAVAPAGP